MCFDTYYYKVEMDSNTLQGVTYLLHQYKSNFSQISNF